MDRLIFEGIFPTFVDYYKTIYSLAESIDKTSGIHFKNKNDDKLIKDIELLFQEIRKILDTGKVFFPLYSKTVSNPKCIPVDKKDLLDQFVNRHLIAVNILANIESFVVIYKNSTESFIKDLAFESICSSSAIISSLSNEIISILNECKKGD